MKGLRVFSRHWAIAVGMGSVIAVGALTYWVGTHRDGCVRTLSRSGNPKTGQEVVYVWGCVQPQRFRQWSVMAATPNRPAIDRSRQLN